MQRLGTKWFCISDFGWRRWSGAPPLDRLPAKAEGARSTHRWLRMHRPLTSFSPPAEAVYWGVATVIPNSFLGARSESWVLGEDQCSHPSKGMLLSGLQRYYLSADTPCTPVRASMQRTRNADIPAIPRNVAGFAIDGPWAQTWLQDRFFTKFGQLFGYCCICNRRQFAETEGMQSDIGLLGWNF